MVDIWKSLKKLDCNSRKERLQHIATGINLTLLTPSGDGGVFRGRDGETCHGTLHRHHSNLRLVFPTSKKFVIQGTMGSVFSTAKVQDRITDRAEGGLGDNKLKELRNEWKQEQEEENVKFSEVRQIQENTKVAVIEVIKEKNDLVRDAVDKKKSFVIYGMKEKKNPNKFTREHEEREMVKTVIKQVQDSTQEFDQEVEEVIRLERYSEGGRRPMKVKMRSLNDCRGNYG
ncbi:hypothetical protein E2C01_044637 [Portunus trituberculatus]|uniref:Uncharacterized protein n=1 Tax=Portunus trituberculatus TaxID=210409 RepID=A0A5B7G0K0_PORTR|nr:hypothetical protein [Portunus trituberculatus]